ncbi:MAG TPA: GAF domain-containing protein [Aggregatilineales bacterium]|nr:GAF domain-containing protein [Chloroflexota bacterium]HOA24599.1 GAF domain-containing protein [Aggregatilineales bacterium]HPV07893.1 GAF domain-containing protein [Aggregatilineales bacterium]HQA67163.1 GAF domain-containing protein [Aggregatilineales bacterium]HQE17279.1 GAF domain-containing protein [Aggregatilineales bacterium]
MDTTTYLRREIARLQQENRALRDEVHALTRYINAIHAFMSTLDELDALEPDGNPIALLDHPLRAAEIAGDAEESSLLLYDEDTYELAFIRASGPVAKPLRGQRMPANRGIAGWALQTGQPTIVNNPYADDRFYAAIDTTLDFRTRSILAVPIAGGGQKLGVIELINKRGGAPFDEFDRLLVELICRMAGHVLHLLVEQERTSEEGAVQPGD